jgi:hypothetical protein
MDASKEEILKSKPSATGLSVVKTSLAASRQQDWKKEVSRLLISSFLHH